MKAILAALRAERARPGIEPTVAARQAHGVELGMQLLRGTHGDALPPPLRAGMAMPSHANALTRRSAGDILGAETLSGVSAQTDEDDQCRQASSRPRLVVRSSGRHGRCAQGGFGAS